MYNEADGRRICLIYVRSKINENEMKKKKLRFLNWNCKFDLQIDLFFGNTSIILSERFNVNWNFTTHTHTHIFLLFVLFLSLFVFPINSGLTVWNKSTRMNWKKNNITITISIRINFEWVLLFPWKSVKNGISIIFIDSRSRARILYISFSNIKTKFNRWPTHSNS